MCHKRAALSGTEEDPLAKLSLLLLLLLEVGSCHLLNYKIWQGINLPYERTRSSLESGTAAAEAAAALLGRGLAAKKSPCASVDATYYHQDHLPSGPSTIGAIYRYALRLLLISAPLSISLFFSLALFPMLPLRMRCAPVAAAAAATATAARSADKMKRCA